jgi:hypothetical protein
MTVDFGSVSVVDDWRDWPGMSPSDSVEILYGSHDYRKRQATHRRSAR